MQTATMPVTATLVVFSATQYVWPGRDGPPEAVRAARWLVSRGIPLVMVSHRAAPDILGLQQELGIRHPFVSDGGAALYIPAGYFPELTRIGAERDGWNIVEFKPPHDTGHAVRLLASLYRLCRDEVVIVGLGDTWAHRVLLHESDVPVVVRSGAADEAQLVQSLPIAYLTNAPGAAGWSEAILGSALE
jgi:predicted mannosyl-3-phosphoglycerate phosphatase (HAD superfamily)